MTKKNPHIPNPPRISLWRRDDGKECMAMIEWDKDASNYYRGSDIHTVRGKAVDHIKRELDRIEKAEDAKKKRLMGRVNKAFDEAMG